MPYICLCEALVTGSTFGPLLLPFWFWLIRNWLMLEEESEPVGLNFASFFCQILTPLLANLLSSPVLLKWISFSFSLHLVDFGNFILICT
jgi:hypothetical protein